MIRVRQTIIFSLVMALLVAWSGGCGQPGTAANITEADARKLLNRDMQEIGQFIAAMSDVLATDNKIGDRARKMDGIVKSYQVYWPGVMESPSPDEALRHMEEGLKKRSRKTVYGSLYGLFSKGYVVANGRTWSAKNVPDYVSRAASKYSTVADNMSSLLYLEQELARFTSGDGTRALKGKSPPAGAEEFGMNGGIYLGFELDPETGKVTLDKYNMDPQYDSTHVTMSVHQVEQFFADEARARLKEGDEILRKRMAPQ
jgi:hypothetical protein